MSEPKLAEEQPFRVGLQLNATGYRPSVLTPGTHEEWIELGSLSATSNAPVVRVAASDLRDAGSRADAIRADAAGQNAPAPAIIIDVEVLVDPDARCALRALARPDGQLQQPSSLRYVGTPRGLAGLLADIRALGIADGVALLPLTMPGSAEHILDGLLEQLTVEGFQVSSDAVDTARLLLVRDVA